MLFSENFAPKSEVDKITQSQKRNLDNNNNMEAAAFMNIANWYKIERSLEKAISGVCEKLPKFPGCY